VIRDSALQFLSRVSVQALRAGYSSNNVANAYPAMTKLYTERISRDLELAIEHKLGLLVSQHVTYRSDSVMSRMVSQESKPWSTKAPRY
jgi:hypothetical protein